MITIGFFFALGFLFMAAVAVPLFLWALREVKKPVSRTYLKSVNICRCEVCFHMYLKAARADFSICPKCKSYNK